LHSARLSIGIPQFTEIFRDGLLRGFPLRPGVFVTNPWSGIMQIKMPIKFHGSYKVVTRKDGMEKQEVCQKLTMSPIAAEGVSEETAPTHLITYFCFGCRRVLEGRIKDNREDGVVFQVDDREFEFCPSKSMC
jgi:hypothetical protein